MDKKLYFKHFGLLFSGTIIGQLINFAAYPILTRIYTPEHYGVFTLFISTVAIFGAISCGRFDAAIHASKNYERFAVFKLSQWTNAFASILVLVGLCIHTLVSPNAFSFMQNILISISIFLTGYCSAISFLLMKNENFKNTSMSNVIRTALTAVPQVLLFYIFPSFWGLILGYCLGYFSQAAYLFYISKSTLKWRRSSAKKIKYAYIKYIDYLKQDVPSQILSVLSFHSVNYFIVILFTAAEVGFYSISYRLAALPLALFSNSLSQVFFQKAAKSFNATGRFWNEFKFNLSSTVFLSLIIFSVLIFTAKPIVGIYLGPEWLVAGEIMIYLAPMLALRFISVSIGTIPLIIMKPKILFVNNFGLLMAIITSFLIAEHYSLSLAHYLILTCLAASLVYIVFISYLFILMARKYR